MLKQMDISVVTDAMKISASRVPNKMKEVPSKMALKTETLCTFKGVF